MALEVKKRYPVPHKTRAHHKLPQRTYKREQRRQSMRRFTSGILVLLILAMAGGIAYTWYMGKEKIALASEAAPPRTTRPVLTPHKIASDAKIGAAVQYMSGEVKPGENASVSIHTNPDANCTIVVKYNQVIATDSGLVPKTADEYGIASWAWTVPTGTPTGAWPVDITCKNKKNSVVVSSQLTVKP